MDATGCDIGVYVGAGATGVVISGATIKGANDHGVFIEDTTGVVVEHSVITHNGLAPAKGVGEAKAVALVGTRGVIPRDTRVTGNLHGGIEVNDDGSIDPGAPDPGTPSPAVGNTISRNRVIGNVGDRGIVIAAYNPGQGVARNIVADNTVVNGKPGAIIVAADPPGAATTDNAVLGNVVTGNLLPGIIVHSNAPNDTVTGTLVLDNTLSGNGSDPEAAGKAGPTKPTLASSSSARSSRWSRTPRARCGCWAASTTRRRPSIHSGYGGLWLQQTGAARPAGRSRGAEGDEGPRGTPPRWRDEGVNGTR